MPRSVQVEDGGSPPQAVAAASRLPATFRALRHRNFRLFFFGQLISLIGTWMQVIAQQWLVWKLTGSETMLGLISLIGVVPLVPMALWSGSISDRFSKRSIIVIAQTVMMIQAFVLAALTWTGAVQVWHVMALAVVLAAAGAVDMPARQAFFVEMVNGKQDLTNAIGLNSAIFNAARILGPAIAGVAVATTGEAMAFFLNGISFIAVIIGLLLMRLPPLARPAHMPPVSSHIVEGIRYVRGQQVVMVLIGLIAVSAFLSMPYSTLLPVFADQVLAKSAQPVIQSVCSAASSFGVSCQSPGALTYGLLMAATGIGAVIGALTVASLPADARRGRLLTMGNLGFPALVILLAVSRSFLLSLVLLMGIGVSFVAQNALANTMLQLATPDGLRGRVMSFYTLTFTVMMRVGGGQAGFMGSWLGAPLAVGLGAVIALAYGIYVALRYPVLRRMA
jgi:MFS family permease